MTALPPVGFGAPPEVIPAPMPPDVVEALARHVVGRRLGFRRVTVDAPTWREILFNAGKIRFRLPKFPDGASKKVDQKTDDGAINAAWVARLCARDWGLYRTLQLNLEKLREGLSDAPLSDGERDLITQRLAAIETAMEDEPKGSKWKLRARVGDKVRWYEDPEEVERHGY